MECLPLGGGLILIPLYNKLFSSDEKETRSTTIFCILPMVITTSIIYGNSNFINLELAIYCSIGGIIGSFIGSKLLMKLNSKYLKLIFILFIIYSGGRILFN